VEPNDSLTKEEIKDLREIPVEQIKEPSENEIDLAMMETSEELESSYYDDDSYARGRYPRRAEPLEEAIETWKRAIDELILKARKGTGFNPNDYSPDDDGVDSRVRGTPQPPVDPRYGNVSSEYIEQRIRDSPLHKLMRAHEKA
jgi:hypothetical protein